MTTISILVDRNIRGILGVFSSNCKAEEAKKKLIHNDLKILKNHLEYEILMNKSDAIILGKLQLINHVLEQPSQRILCTNIEYNDITSSLDRYVIYCKQLNEINTSAIIVGYH
jgi:hypothetical protein